MLFVKRFAVVMFAASALMTSGATYAVDKPSVLLVHGAFAESNSWDGVIKKLNADGYPAVGVANRYAG